MKADRKLTNTVVSSYEQLMKLYPEVEQYKVYFAQSLYKAGMYPESIKACTNVESEEYDSKVPHLLVGCCKLLFFLHYDANFQPERMQIEKLRASACFEQDDLTTAKNHLRRCLQDDPEVLVMEGCIAYKELDYEAALKYFTEAMNITGWEAHIAYNIALCNYCMKRFTVSLRSIQEIIERGVQNHPELSVGGASDGYDVRSVGNSQTLRNTALIEAFNLKYAIYFQMRNCMYGCHHALIFLHDLIIYA